MTPRKADRPSGNASQPGGAAAPPANELRRTLGLWQLTVSGVGIVIGAGIYVLIGHAAAQAGSAVWLSFTLAAVLSVFTGLSYAELAGMYPSAGAEFEFARRAFNPFIGFLSGWAMVAGNIVAAAAVAIGFGHYLGEFITIDVRVAAAGLLVVLTTIICAGIQRSIWLSTALVVAQVGGLLLVVATGLPHLGDHALLEGAAPGGVLAGAALVFFAFIGFDEVVTLSDETRDPARVVPLALLLALGISTLLYLGVGVAAVSLLGGETLATSDRPLALVLAHNWGRTGSALVSGIALASTTNTSLLVLTAASRLIYSMANAGAFPSMLARLSGRHAVPRVAALVGLLCALPLAATGSIGLIAAATDFLVYAIFLAVNGAVIALRFRAPDAPRWFRAPLHLGVLPLTPVVGLLTVALMMAYLDPSALLLGLALLLPAALVWWLRGGAHPTGNSAITSR